MLSCRTLSTWCLAALISLWVVTQGQAEKYRFCVVDGKSHFKKSLHYCPQLDKPDSKVECVLALDRLDCLRRLNKGTVDFTVLTPEDLVTAQNAGVDLLVTNELRYTNDAYDYEVVAVINNNSGIKNRMDLRDKRYCHPGYGYEADWSRILANYFESSVVIPSCDPKLSITENRIKATADFFASACKAGPWVTNQTLENILKSKYSSLCELCGEPYKCSRNDKYWGRRGTLLCLTDGAGDVSWARWDDVQPHFGLVPGQSDTTPESYSLLCPDDTILPVNTTHPCVWVVRPWSVIGSVRTKAQEIQKIISTLKHEDYTTWRYSLLNLIQDSYTVFQNIDPVDTTESYLDRAKGFLSANSFSGCHPPRTIRICTTSIIENAKCSWLRESSAVYGIEPDLECLKADNTSHCMQAVQKQAADIVLVSADLVHEAKVFFNLSTLFYETVRNEDKYLTVAVTLPNRKISSFEELRGKRICFPTYDGVAWNTVKQILFNKGLISACPLDKSMGEFFGPSCTSNLPKHLTGRMNKLCQETSFDGEYGALHCLTTGVGDVAFVSYNSISKYLSDKSEDNPGSTLTMKNFQILFCGNESTYCHLSWATPAQAMVRGNASDLWKSDTLDVFIKLDELFGKNYQSLTNPFNLFGRFDGKSDILFKDSTVRLRSVPDAKDTAIMMRNYESMLNVEKLCIHSAGSIYKIHKSYLVVVCLMSILGNFISVF